MRPSDCTEHAQAVAHLARAMRAVDRALIPLDAEHRESLGNALLNLAVSRMIDSDGAVRTASVLTRLAEAVLRGPIPSAHRAVDLTALQS